MGRKDQPQGGFTALFFHTDVKTKLNPPLLILNLFRPQPSQFEDGPLGFGNFELVILLQLNCHRDPWAQTHPIPESDVAGLLFYSG